MRGDCLLENGLDVRDEIGQAGGRKAIGSGPRVEAGSEEALVGVDVAHPGHRPLVEEKGLEPGPSTHEGGEEAVRLGVEGVRTQGRPVCNQGFERGQGHQTAEPTRITEGEAGLGTRPKPQVPRDMPVVVRKEGAIPLHGELAGHAQVDDEHPAVLGDDRGVLPMSGQPLDGRSGEERSGWRGGTPAGPGISIEDRRSSDRDLGDRGTTESTPEGATKMLDFGKFRHGGSLEGPTVAGSGNQWYFPALAASARASTIDGPGIADPYTCPASLGTMAGRRDRPFCTDRVPSPSLHSGPGRPSAGLPPPYGESP